METALISCARRVPHVSRFLRDVGPTGPRPAKPDQRFSGSRYNSPMSSNFLTFQAVDGAQKCFLDFWAAQYKDDLEGQYEKNIGRLLTDAAIVELFEWKNGGKLSKAKRESVDRNYVAKKACELVTQAVAFPQGAGPDELTGFATKFLTEGFTEGGAIWRIFWLHCCNQRFPVYDQHVHRSMVFIGEGRIEELDAFPERKIDLYLKKYLLFHNSFPDEHRKVDKALYAFGRFAKAWPGLLPTPAGPRT
jgi:hypothetical protein